MSRIYFHSISGTAEIKGMERHWMGAMCEHIGLGALGVLGLNRLAPVIDGVQCAGRTDEAIALSIRHGSNVTFRVNGQRIPAFSLLLNTCVDIGNDALRLLARIHGQCELHAYVAGEHRAWMADVIEYGRKWNMMRADMGWEKLVTFLRSSSTETVVMSYSVCDGFPNRSVAERGGWTPPAERIPEEGLDEDEFADKQWYAIDHHTRFDLALKGLEGQHLRIGPDTIGEGFDSGASAFNVLAELSKTPG